MNATISQSQINIALAGCEFFLQTNNAGEIFANLRIGREVQRKFPGFVGEILKRLENFEGAQVIWRGLPRHGWYSIQFQSTLNHYISLAARNCNPLKAGRCAPSNLSVNRLRTLNLLRQLISRRDRLAAAIGQSPVTQAPVIDDQRERLSAAITQWQRGNHAKFHELMNPTPVQKSVHTETIVANSFAAIPDPWTTPEQFPAVETGILDRPSCPIILPLLLPPHVDPSPEAESETELWAAARSAFGEWETEARDKRRSELSALTKAQLGELLGWQRGKVYNTKKAALVEALLDLESGSESDSKLDLDLEES